MKRFAYLPLFLLLTAQVDDALVAAVRLPAAPLAEAEDEFLPAPRASRQEESASVRRPVPVPRTSPSAVVRPGLSPVPSEPRLTSVAGPSPLYEFMSLQI